MRTPAFRWPTGTTLVLAVVCCTGVAGLPTPTRADGPAPATPGSLEPAWLAQSMSVVGGALKSLGSGAASTWSNLTDLVTPSRPSDLLPDRISDNDRQFFAVLDAIGLQVSEVKLGGTLISSSSYRLVAARAPSVADFEHAERKLSEYCATSDGLRSQAKQRIARSVLDLAGAKDFVLSAVVIELSPWPSVRYELDARNRPPEAAERRVVEGVQAQ